MRDNRSAPLTMQLRRGEVCVADGFGIRIRVDKQHLVIDDGSGRDRETRRYARATHGLSRLVVIGSEGYVTLEAIRWLTSLGIGYLHLDRDGTILAATENGSGDARLRRLQATAANTAIGIELGRYLLDAKLEGQAHNLECIPNSERSQGVIGYWRQRISEARTLDELLEAEREAAAAYWACWAQLPLRFARRDLDHVPDHWHRVGTRHSPLSSSPRVAITPANAILNYLYAILEAETRIACLTLGLDPGLGICHADYRSRDSFVLDLMEAARPDVDRFVLQLIDTCTFTRKDVGETSRGICRLRLPLTLELAQTAHQWRDAIAPHAEHAARLLAGTPGARVEQLATPLTGQHRSRGQDHRRRRVRARRAEKPAANCKRCGGPVPRRERVYCDDCFALPQRERRTPTEAAEATVGETPLRSARRCKRCGDPVPHRKRVYCDTCFAHYERELSSLRRRCKTCGEPTPDRKRVYCDGCLAARRQSAAESLGIRPAS